MISRRLICAPEAVAVLLGRLHLLDERWSLAELSVCDAGMDGAEQLCFDHEIDCDYIVQSITSPVFSK